LATTLSRQVCVEALKGEAVVLSAIVSVMDPWEFDANNCLLRCLFLGGSPYFGQ
jgi:hypothetical protein